MRVVIFPSGLPEDYCLQMGRALLEKKLEVGLVLSEKSYQDLAPFVPEGMRIFRYRHKWDILPLFWEIVRFHPDILHYQDGTDLISSLFVHLFWTKKIYTTFHDVQMHPESQGWRKRWVRWMLRLRSSRFFVHGNILKTMFCSLYPRVEPSRVVAIPMGVHNFALFDFYSREEPIQKPADTVVFLHFGWIAPRKGTHVLLEAFHTLRKKYDHVALVIAGRVGHEPYYQRLQRLAQELAVEGVTWITREISWREGGKLYREADVVVLPYLEISQSGVVPVAYGFGKPLIATSVGGLVEVVHDHETGILVPPSDKEALLEAMEFFVRHSECITSYGQRGKQLLEEAFSWSIIADTLVNVYQGRA